MKRRIAGNGRRRPSVPGSFLAWRIVWLGRFPVRFLTKHHFLNEVPFMNAQRVNCPHDGCLMEHDVRNVTITYKGLSKSVDVPGWYCRECGEGIHSGKDLKITDKALNELKMQSDGLLSPQEYEEQKKIASHAKRGRNDHWWRTARLSKV
ncbi:MAG: YgiT-type zinc finger protein [Desulfovibrionaceae bacterium]|nr:YgiT-type zinc finger protein [Desulfovibrionaceae bacterium]